MTIQEKLDKISQSGWKLAYDGCHKIYFLQDEGRVADAISMGYEPLHESDEIYDLWNDSCGLRFVNRWGYTNDDFYHEWNIEQFEEEEEDSPTEV